MWFAKGVDGVTLKIGDRFAMNLVGRTGVEFHIAGQSNNIGTGLRQRLADIQRLQSGKFVCVLQHQMTDFGQ